MQASHFRALGALGLAVYPLGLGTNKWAAGHHDVVTRYDAYDGVELREAQGPLIGPGTAFR
jgi:hypothetical protein